MGKKNIQRIMFHKSNFPLYVTIREKKIWSEQAVF